MQLSRRLPLPSVWIKIKWPHSIKFHSKCLDAGLGDHVSEWRLSRWCGGCGGLADRGEDVGGSKCRLPSVGEMAAILDKSH